MSTDESGRMIDVHIIGTDELTAARSSELRALLDRAFDGDFTDDDWGHALGGLHVMAFDGQAIVAHASVVPRLLEIDDRSIGAGYVEAVATDPSHQRTGWGRVVMTVIADLVTRQHDLGALCTGTHEFYERLGWERWQGPTFVRHADRVERSPDEDDAIMILRCPATVDVDTRTSITCLTRPGDDW